MRYGTSLEFKLEDSMRVGRSSVLAFKFEALLESESKQEGRAKKFHSHSLSLRVK